MTATFLNGVGLGPAITELLRGQEVRCAVAFWGDGAVAKLFPKKGMSDRARILCDITVGSTNPAELRRLGAPDNLRLRHVPRLHAKIYMSDRGAIVCSANASDNGIGFVDVAGLVEAGVLLDPDEQAYRDAATWFDAQWDRSEELNAEALAQAADRWRRRPRSGTGLGSRIPKNVPSLLATVAADPARFRGIGFAFTFGTAEREDLREASVAIRAADRAQDVSILTKQEERRIENWPIGDVFTEWSEQDLDAWPRRFVCIHWKGDRPSYWFYQRVYETMIGQDRGVVLAERPRGLRRMLGFEFGKDAMLSNDLDLLNLLRRHCEEKGHWLCESGDQLLLLLDEALAGEGAGGE